jgi:hypothetical protein
MEKKERPYWLSGGTETCHACTHPYVYELEVRCVACDRGLCVHCAIIVKETREAWCPACHAEGDA